MRDEHKGDPAVGRHGGEECLKAPNPPAEAAIPATGGPGTRGLLSTGSASVCIGGSGSSETGFAQQPGLVVVTGRAVFARNERPLPTHNFQIRGSVMPASVSSIAPRKLGKGG